MNTLETDVKAAQDLIAAEINKYATHLSREYGTDIFMVHVTDSGGVFKVQFSLKVKS